MQLRKNTPIYLTAILFGLLATLPATAQTFTVSESSTMTIFGSANVTDWEAKVKTIRGSIQVNIPEGADWAQVAASWFESVAFSFPVADIDSDSRRMNNNMHGYLKKDEHPEITYRLVEVRELAATENPGVLLTVRGVIKAAGVEKEITHDVEIRQSESGGLVVAGSQDLKMTDFGIDPPTAVLGSIRSRDEMTITFEFHLD